MRHIFIEGPDGVGKSTLIKGLSKKLNLPVIKMKKAGYGFRTGTIEGLSYIFNTTLEQFNRYGYIVDRGFITSLVYNKAYERNNDKEFEYIEKINNTIKPIIILLTADKNEILKRRKKDKIITDEMRLRVYNEYNKFYKQNKIDNKYNVYRINSTSLTPGQVLEKTISYIQKYEKKFEKL